MNIMEYRALKAQEVQPSSQNQTVATPQTQEVHKPSETKPVDIKPTETKPAETPETKPVIPEKIIIDGVGEVSIDELKNGYLRQADYTKKTQEVAHQKKEAQEAVTFYENVKKNPQIIQQIKQNVQVPPTLDPSTQKIVELESRVYDMMIQNEINALQSKYPDFEVREVLEMAQKKQLTNLEDAYLLAKSAKSAAQKPVDANAIKEQIRREVLKELEAERGATQTIISSNGSTAPITDNSPKMNDAEKKVARMMRLSEADYVKWRDAGRKK